MSNSIWSCDRCGSGCTLIICNHCPNTVVEHNVCPAVKNGYGSADWKLIRKAGDHG